MAVENSGGPENKISVIATTQGRFLEMATMLYSVNRQGDTPIELVAGIQDSPVTADQLVLAPKYDLVTVPLPKCSLSRARNALLPHTTGNIIVLADDDVVYPEGLFPMVDVFFSAHSSCGVVICDCDKRMSQALPAKQTRQQLFQRAPSHRLFFRRRALIEAGPFDENMGVGAPTPWQSGEETDMLLRIFDTGHEIWRITTPPIKHPDPIVYTMVPPEKITGYGYGRMYLLAKHRFPLWFKIVNITHPLAAIGSDLMSAGAYIVSYRLRMFAARLTGFFRNFP